MPETEPSSDFQTEIERLFRERYRAGSSWCKEIHSDARTDFEFYAGHQWDEKDLSRGREIQSPTLTLNQIFSIVNAPSSSEIVNRYEPKYLPRSPEDQELSDNATETARYIRQHAGAEFVDSGVFRDALICGMGAASWYFDESIGKSGRIQTSRIPIEELIWDPAARKQNLEDARWIIRGMWLGVDEFKARFPGVDLPPTGSPDDGGGSIGMFMWGRSDTHITDPVLQSEYETEGGDGFYVPERRSVLVFEMQDWYVETEWRVDDPETGEEVTLSDEGYRRWRKVRVRTGDGIPEARPKKKRVYRRTIFSGMHFVKQEELPSESFSILFLTCFEDQTETGVKHFGMTRPLIDPQRVANSGFSMVLHILATNPKGVMLYEEGVFEDERAAETEWAKPHGRVKVRPGALQEKRIEIVHGQYPDDFERITTFSLNAVPRIAAIDPYFMGSGGGDLRRVSGNTLSQVLQQGQMMLSIPFDGLRKFRMDQGRLLLDYMVKFIPQDENIRVLGDNSQPSPQFIQFRRGELKNVDFDIVVSETPLSPTEQRESWTALTESGALSSLLEQNLLGGEDIADLAFGWPEDVRRRVRERAIRNEQMQIAAMNAQQGGGVPPQGQPPQGGGPTG